MMKLSIIFLVLLLVVSCATTQGNNNITQHNYLDKPNIVELRKEVGKKSAKDVAIFMMFLKCDSSAQRFLTLNSLEGKITNPYAKLGLSKHKGTFWYIGDTEQYEQGVRFSTPMKIRDIEIIGSTLIEFDRGNKRGTYWGFYFSDDVQTVLQKLNLKKEYENVLGALTRVIHFDEGIKIFSLMEKTSEYGSKSLMTCLVEKIKS